MLLFDLLLFLALTALAGCRSQDLLVSLFELFLDRLRCDQIVGKALDLLIHALVIGQREEHDHTSDILDVLQFELTSENAALRDLLPTVPAVGEQTLLDLVALRTCPVAWCKVHHDVLVLLSIADATSTLALFLIRLLALATASRSARYVLIVVIRIVRLRIRDVQQRVILTESSGLHTTSRFLNDQIVLLADLL